MSNIVASIDFWQFKGRPQTEVRTSGGWVGVPGADSPKPGVDYRLAINWGPVTRMAAPENSLDKVQIRVVFDGWSINGQFQFANAIQFYTDQSFTKPSSTPSRATLDLPSVFKPDNADVQVYAYFRVTAQHDHAWRMHYQLALYGSLALNHWGSAVAL